MAAWLSISELVFDKLSMRAPFHALMRPIQPDLQALVLQASCIQQLRASCRLDHWQTRHACLLSSLVVVLCTLMMPYTAQLRHIYAKLCLVWHACLLSSPVLVFDRLMVPCTAQLRHAYAEVCSVWPALPTRMCERWTQLQRNAASLLSRLPGAAESAVLCSALVQPACNFVITAFL